MFLDVCVCETLIFLVLVGVGQTSTDVLRIVVMLNNVWKLASHTHTKLWESLTCLLIWQPAPLFPCQWSAAYHKKEDRGGRREGEREEGMTGCRGSSDVMPIAASHLWKSIHVSTLTLIIYPPQINSRAGLCRVIASSSHSTWSQWKHCVFTNHITLSGWHRREQWGSRSFVKYRISSVDKSTNTHTHFPV